MIKKKRLSVAVFGGAFDPVHLGHLKTTDFIQSNFNFDHFFFVPCKTTLLKDSAKASTAHRVNMLKLALDDYPDFTIDLREIRRETPSYMVDTLQSYRSEYPEASLSLILGEDAFHKLTQWHQWEKIIQLAHLIVINRPGYHLKNISHELKQLLKQHETKEKDQILTSKSGLIFRLNAGNHDISSTEIRRTVKSDQTSSIEVTEKVYDYIRKYKLYQ
ncbi:nicotinate-nucleotide adenylyltransferase [Legionella israelensis]|uniref:Probable nicotinate-nucleotide adenylyltransferase n=1 Tax=Legionella israelensis TaxID=454 RepID=A0AAX1EG43_9GAMM|nr:nicotinate-nucleotide adenylyltransferase [Legionella israelensis]QBR84115.1 nicotinate-nucleotide adenylyltransferase [Legionella israelensis]